jgi:hypothetical protein
MEETSNNITKYLSPTAQSGLKSALSVWAMKNKIRPRDFARRMGYTPAYGWSLLRGTAPVTIPTIGLFLLRYGINAAGELLELFNEIETQEISSMTNARNGENK